ncbi:hypothetical protein [Endozoicomonas numazuensis]|uniref:Uncharacterized protein n=1 Tax=Endozoicomonas numazuensis TaxID=1137799 RepID=A0A081NLF0_9GAMM|nr:hypothetical protein [Endozoicomonas numazuensis]KEQ19273.1 hypothetical protein GZ78_04630 [Endozoicomonas numazuensis]
MTYDLSQVCIVSYINENNDEVELGQLFVAKDSYIKQWGATIELGDCSKKPSFYIKNANFSLSNKKCK